MWRTLLQTTIFVTDIVSNNDGTMWLLNPGQANLNRHIAIVRVRRLKVSFCEKNRFPREQCDVSWDFLHTRACEVAGNRKSEISTNDNLYLTNNFNIVTQKWNVWRVTKPVDRLSKSAKVATLPNTQHVTWKKVESQTAAILSIFAVVVKWIGQDPFLNYNPRYTPTKTCLQQCLVMLSKLKTH